MSSSFWQFWRHQPAILRILALLVGVILGAAPIALPIYLHEVAATQGKSVILAPACLVLVLVLALPVWLRRVHHVRHPWQKLGWMPTVGWWQSWGLALGLGAISVMLLCGLQTALGWSTWMWPERDRALRFALEGLGLGLGVGLAEELLFRGWALFELEQDYSPALALWLNGVLFAIAHYIRPLASILATWPQFFGLLILGLTLVWARRIPWPSSDGVPHTHLGFAAGLHGGLVWAYYQVDVGDLMMATGQVPAWVTGIDGNPLAGVLGILLMSGLGGFTYWASHRHPR